MVNWVDGASVYMGTSKEWIWFLEFLFFTLEVGLRIDLELKLIEDKFIRLRFESIRPKMFLKIRIRSLHKNYRYEQ